ncbi:transporter, major facilitator family protein [Dictyocaulus viviparus]|uniref:Transporter, major facilitator family protein n=1 Tax=Dictyocaulus viviparus TaxID=29172 RepID=A0A0D8XUT1_DICVI|nr:transporter, major facilitator family protein [Dictyocaulus viviparus]
MTISRRHDTLESINDWMTALPNFHQNKSHRPTIVSKQSEVLQGNVIINNSEKHDKKTSWRSIYLLTAICMFCGVQFSIYFPSLWPFLNTVDPTASDVFFGIITASYSVGQGIASPLFGLWMNRSKSVRSPLIVGITVMILSNTIFCFVEAFMEKKRRWVMLVSRLFIGLGAGTVGVMRAYAATASTLTDRARAITLIQASYVIGMTIGPAIPVAFAPIQYPGWVVGPLHVDMYTASAWLASIICIVSLILLLIMLEENYAGIEEKYEDDYNPLPTFDVLGVSICVITQFTMMFIITNLETVGSMYAMVMWSWTKRQAVIYIGILQAINGIFSMFLYAAFVGKLGDCMSKGRERIFTMIGLAMALLYHVLTFPFPIGPTLRWTTKVVSHNVTYVGCNPNQYKWCHSVHRVNLWLYAVLYCTLLASCFPIVTISMNTLFSKILGARRQGTMQGVMLMSGSLARTFGPLLVSVLFQLYGPEPVWGIEIATLTITLILWMLFYRHLVPLRIPDLSSGEYMKYPNGIKYRL